MLTRPVLQGLSPRDAAYLLTGLGCHSYSDQVPRCLRRRMCCSRIKVGTRLGSYFDLHGEPSGDALSPHDGIVLAIHPGPIMGNGETLVHIGLDPREV